MKPLLPLTLLLACATPLSAQLLSWESLCEKNEYDPLERIYLDIPVLDLPYQASVASATGNNMTAITNQSMATTLALCEDFQVATHLGIRELLGNRKISRYVIWGFEFLAEFLPFGSSWGHEEYHRAVMGYRGVESYDEVWNMQFFSSSISVSHETDEAMTAFHDNHINDFIRMNAAGLEAQTHLVQRLQQNDFFYHRHLNNAFSYWMNILNNQGYIEACSDPETDADVEEMNNKEPEIKQRDFTGFDLSAWGYELFHPGVKYTDRGIHPSGTGINRYITSDQIGADGLDYLKKQSKREYLNLISPMMFGINRIRLGSTLSGEWYGNFAVRHYLTHFGDDISLDLYLDAPNLKLVAAPHIYSNYNSRFWGLEVGVVDLPFLQDKLLLNATAKVWTQPENFTTTEGKFGGMLSADASYLLGKRWMAYLELSAKTAGWQQGNVHLGSNFSGRAGLRWLIFDGSK